MLLGVSSEAPVKPSAIPTCRVKLSDVTHGEVQRWITGLWLAPGSVRKVHRVLSMVLAYAVKDGRLAVNPAAGISLPREMEKRFLTHRQVHELAEACREEYRLVVLFLAYTGLRWGEMAALRVNRLDLLRRRALVAESVRPVKGVMTFGPTKGHDRREVPLPRFLLDDLARQVAGRAAGDLVFTGERGRGDALADVPACRADRGGEDGRAAGLPPA